MSTVSLALRYGLRLDASEAFIQGYVDGMRLDQRGQGVACGKGWIPRSKKCSRDKATATPKEAKARTAEKARERAKLKGEVKAAKGQKPRVKEKPQKSSYSNSFMQANPNRETYKNGESIEERFYKDLAAKSSAMKGKKESITVPMRNKKTGEVEREVAVKADVYGDIAIHKGEDLDWRAKGGGNAYVVTHIPSGLALVTSGSLREAKEGAYLAHALGGVEAVNAAWNKSGQNPQKVQEAFSSEDFASARSALAVAHAFGSGVAGGEDVPPGYTFDMPLPEQNFGAVSKQRKRKAA